MDSIHTQLLEAIFTMSRLMKDQMTTHSDVCDLSLLQLQTLVLLKKTPNMQMTDIASHFSIELPSATSLINKLVKAKLVARKANPKDRRVVLIQLTSQGDKLLEKGIKERSKKVEENLSYLSMEDKKNLLAILRKMITKMEETHEK